MSFALLEPCPGVSGDGCPHGSVIDHTRQLCHTCRRDQQRLADYLNREANA